MAQIYTIIPTSEKVLILGVRQALIYPFTAPNWGELRLGFYISVTQAVANDTVTGCEETLAFTNAADRVFIGFKDNSDGLPDATQFFGISNMRTGITTAGTLADFTGTDEYIYTGAANTCIFGRATGTTFSNSSAGASPQFSQNAAFTNGRAVLVLLRMVRAPGANTIDQMYSASINDAGTRYVTTDKFSNVASIAEIRAAFRTLPGASQWINEATSKTFTTVPDSFYAYWPFNSSRLRIHSVCIEQFA